MRFRIKKYKKGWIVEYRTFGLFPKWKHVTHYAGLPDDPFYYKTGEGARDGALSEIGGDINYSFHFD